MPGGDKNERKLRGVESNRHRSSTTILTDYKERSRSAMKDTLFLKQHWRTKEVLYSKAAQVPFCGCDSYAVAMTSDQLIFLSSGEWKGYETRPTPEVLTPSRNDSRRGGVGGNVWSQEGGSLSVYEYEPRFQVYLHSILEIVMTESNDKHLVLHYHPEGTQQPNSDEKIPSLEWQFSKLSFDNRDSRDDFVACIVKLRKKKKNSPLHFDMVREPILNMEAARRTISAVRLRRALEEANLSEIETEEDYLNVGKHTGITSFLKSQSDSVIFLSLNVRVPDLGHDCYALVITERCLYFFQQTEYQYRYEMQIRIEQLEALIQVRPEGNSNKQYMIIQQTTLDKKDDHEEDNIDNNKHRKEHYMEVLPLEDNHLTAERLGNKIQRCLERLYLEVKIDRLPFRIEKMAKSRVRKTPKTGPLKQVIAKVVKAFTRDGKGEEISNKRTRYEAMKWLLLICRVRLFDLIDTFTKLNVAHQQSHEDSTKKTRHDMAAGFIGRRLGLSLVGLCAHLDLTHQLIYEALLYELMSNSELQSDSSDLFGDNTFAISILNIYTGSRAEQYVRLALSEPLQKFLNTYEASTDTEKDFDTCCELFLTAILSCTKYLPHELRVICAVIHRCVSFLYRSDAFSPDLNRYIGAYMMQRIWTPALKHPTVTLGLVLESAQITSAKRDMLRRVSEALNSSIGLGNGIPRKCIRELSEEYLTSLVDPEVFESLHLPEADDFANNNDGDGAVDSHQMLRRKQSVVTIPLMRRDSSHYAAIKARSKAKEREKKDYSFEALRFNVQSDNNTAKHEVLTLSKNLESVHQALGRDTERLMVSMILGLSDLDMRIKEQQQSLAEQELSSSHIEELTSPAKALVLNFDRAKCKEKNEQRMRAVEKLSVIASCVLLKAIEDAPLVLPQRELDGIRKETVTLEDILKQNVSTIDTMTDEIFSLQKEIANLEKELSVSGTQNDLSLTSEFGKELDKPIVSNESISNHPRAVSPQLSTTYSNEKSRHAGVYFVDPHFNDFESESDGSDYREFTTDPDLQDILLDCVTDIRKTDVKSPPSPSPSPECLRSETVESDSSDGTQTPPSYRYKLTTHVFDDDADDDDDDYDCSQLVDSAEVAEYSPDSPVA